MPYDKSLPYACRCCGYWNGDMKYDYYKHQEPLIKNEKIRKVVRAWAEANGDTKVRTGGCLREFWGSDSVLLEFKDYTGVPDATFEYDTYTIDELCGVEQ